MLGEIGAINWETSEFILEETEEFLSEITHAHRLIVIGCSEQLAATSIAIAWSSANTLLLMGADNRNVLFRHRKDMPRKGAH